MLIKGRGAAEAWCHVDLEEPRLKLVVYQYIKAVHLVALAAVLSGAHLRDNVRLGRHQCLDADVLDLTEHLVVVHACLLVLLAELL